MISRKRLHIDWVAAVVNVTLVIAAVVLIVLLGIAGWVITH